ncbi:hypothetical protein A2686_02175 [Candidatus Woesebacteria bacterium RIFCSPHIGHO2_01_FULL_38_10]|uniref:DUF4258 domain-containing protein n=1 Tax=Candidatus Woesebacteria bacterium RIFCSPLOWO2_01_FULL_39_10b TaxID=1802517 RepID=A0A1F8B9Q8_9BACT|nr:MAG: hypothetical protein A2686_02175 [Candidatus Woesebacteria bacterium RIFCSPHIGHO2_01_FULL_38_10]OGM60784.1 MAG: hypothetical protein A2892_01945 [Candidatus Woesebacteria bacterium RIFCSPLOWO2_01_FULL_39_10b]
MQNEYKGLIFTKHAIKRMRERGIKQGDVWATWRFPDKSRYESLKGVWVYQRTFANQEIEVVVKKNDKGKWLILSVWLEKPLKRKVVKKVSLVRQILKLLKKSPFGCYMRTQLSLL